MNAHITEWERKQEENIALRAIKDAKDVIKCKICGFIGIGSWVIFTIFCYINGGV